MLGTTETVLMYYLGLGFVIFLGWAIAVPDRQLDETTASHYLRWTTIAAILGVLHPAVALATRDIIGQVGIGLPDKNDGLRRRHARATAIINVLAIASAIPVVVVLTLTAL